MAKADSTEKVEHQIYRRLLDVIPDLMSIEAAGRSHVDGYMDLGLDVLSRTPEKLVIALSHYYAHPSGDMIPDPDMEIAIYPAREWAEAMAYQDCFGYQSVSQARPAASERLRTSLNAFLLSWLGNLIEQGHHCLPLGKGAAAQHDNVALS